MVLLKICFFFSARFVSIFFASSLNDLEDLHFACDAPFVFSLNDLEVLHVTRLPSVTGSEGHALAESSMGRGRLELKIEHKVGLLKISEGTSGGSPGKPWIFRYIR